MRKEICCTSSQTIKYNNNIFNTRNILLYRINGRR